MEKENILIHHLINKQDLEYREYTLNKSGYDMELKLNLLTIL